MITLFVIVAAVCAVLDKYGPQITHEPMPYEWSWVHFIILNILVYAFLVLAWQFIRLFFFSIVELIAINREPKA